MVEALGTVLKQPYWVLAMVLGSALVGAACITIDSENHWTAHSPATLWLPLPGIALLCLSGIAFFWNAVISKPIPDANTSSGIDVTNVREEAGTLVTNVGDCEIRAVFGRIEDHASEPGTAVVLPSNEYFDDECFSDRRTALGAYVSQAFEGQLPAFISLVSDECRKQLGCGTEEQKTSDSRSVSYGAGRCLLLARPLGRAISVALVASTTQRAGRGLSARISYLFDGMRELVGRLADSRINAAVMPILAAGHGGIYPPLALVGTLAAIAEAARYGEGGQRLKKATIVVFRRDEDSRPEVAEAVVRRALALVGQQD